MAVSADFREEERVTHSELKAAGEVQEDYKHSNLHSLPRRELSKSLSLLPHEMHCTCWTLLDSYAVRSVQ